jgi:hypothetical protein
MKGWFPVKNLLQEWQIVLVEWDDITSHDGAWLDLKEAEEYSPTPMKTMGFLLKDEPDYVIVVSTASEILDVVGSTNAIPRGCIKKITKLSDVNAESPP